LSSWFGKFKNYKNLAIPKPGEALSGIVYVTKMWLWIFFYIFSPVYHYFIKFIRHVLKKNAALVNDVGSDSDYIIESDASDSDETDDDSASSQESNEELYKEIFHLTQENGENNSDLLNQTGIRTRRNRPIISTRSINPSSFATSFTSLECVVCQTNVRNIGKLFLIV
jgi:hypothetical protein